MFSRKKKLIKIILIFFIALPVFFPLSSRSAAPKEISYQGKLTNASNVAVADGNYSMVISIYTAASGGTPVWTAQGTVGAPTAKSVAVANGIFSTMLGESGDNALTLDFDVSYWLGVKVGSDAEMTPRKKIGSAGYAFNAQSVISDGKIDIDNIAASTDAVNINYNPTSGSGDATEIIYGAGGGTGTALKVAQNGNGMGAMITNLGTGISFRVNDETGEADTTPFLIDATGNVGIGTTDPGAFKLYVNGNAYVSGTLSGISTLTATTFSGTLSGNATTATTLQTARTIWGQSFNGSAAISGALSGVTTIGMSGALTANLGATASYPLVLTSSSVTTSMGSLNGSYFHNDTTATSGFYYYDNVTTAGNLVAIGTVTGSNLSGTNTGDQTLAGLGGAPVGAKYIVQTADATLTAEQALGALGTGILKNTTTTGVLSIAVAGDFPTLNQSTTGSAATLTTARNINGVSFNGSADITVTAAAGTLTGATLASGVTGSSLTSVGTLGSLAVTGAITWSGGGSTNANTAYSERLQWDGGSTNLVVATGRTSLGLVAGGTGDIWVEKAGDTMTGNLTISPTLASGSYSLFVTGASGAARTVALMGITGISNGFTVSYDGTNMAYGFAGPGGTVTASTFSGALSGNATTATTLQTARTIWGQSFNGSAAVSGALSGATTITASGAITGSNLSGTNTGDQTITLTGDVTGSGTGSFAATIAANSVALTTDTTGNYVAGLTAGTAITITGTAGEAWSPTVGVTADAITDTQLLYNTGQHLTTTSSPTFGTVTAALSGNATTATTLQTARTINGVSFNGSANIAVPSLYDTNYRRITNPGGAEYVTSAATVTGAIEIIMPAWVSGMYKMNVEVYEYTTNESFTLVVGGHTSGTTWYNEFAYILGSQSVDRRFNVRFGINAGGKPVIYIGELASSWSYPQVYVTEFQHGYSGAAVSFTTGWTIGFQTSAFAGVTRTQSNVQIGYALSTNTANSVALRDASGNFSAGTITAALSGNATTATTLQTARTIWGQSFNGSANISGAITGASTGSFSGTVTAPTFSGALSGNATTATTLQTARTIWGQSFNGSAAISGALSGATTGSFSSTVTAPTFSGALSGNATTATAINVADIRGTAPTPNAIGVDHGVTSQFNDQWGGGWRSTLTVNGWTDGYAVWQLMGGSTTSTEESWSLRSGVNSTWNSWREIVHSGNIGSQSVNYATSAGNADTLDGLHLNSTTTNNQVNTVVRTNASGYADFGWINTVSGDSGIANDLSRIYVSNDAYLRYLGKSDFKVLVGLSGKTTYDRRDSTADSNYWVGSLGWSSLDMNGVFNGGSSFIDVWSGTNMPPGTSHVQGMQSLHYTTGTYPTAGGTSYGIQIAGQYSQGGVLYTRGSSAGTFSSWYKMWTEATDGSGSGLDADLWDGYQFASYLNQAVLTSSSPTFANVQLGASGYVGLNGGTSFGIGVNSSNRNSAVFDTIEAGGADSLELNYYTGAAVIIGTGANGSKALYAGSLYDAGNRVYSAGNPQVNISGNAATLTNFTSNPTRSDGGDYSLAGRTTGLYAIAGAGTNGPGPTYLSLIHAANGTDVAFQIAGGYVHDAMYFRGTSALQNGTGYTSWRTVIHSGNIGSQTVATASNNVLKSGDTMTGTLSMSGTSAVNFSTYGGGWFMQDTSWIRSTGGKNIWLGAGLLGADGGLTVGYGGTGSPAGGAIIAGNVGIGTTGPSQKLEVSGISRFNSGVSFSAINTGFASSHGYSTGDWGIRLGATGSAGVIQAAQSSTAYPILLNPYGGNVGIGTTSSGQKLDVVGTLRSRNSAGDKYIQLRNDGGALDIDFGGGVLYIGNGSQYVNVGTLSKGAGSFKIDHPLDPTNKFLYHSFVESPDMKNIYDGIATLGENGEVVVTMPNYFEALNRDFRYLLTPLGNPQMTLYIKQEITGNKFIIAGGSPGAKVSWQVTGSRKDAFALARPIEDEKEKVGDEQGKLLYPEAMNAYQEKSLAITTAPVSANNYFGQIFLDSVGNLGIGTTSPTEKLTVVGNLNLVGGSLIVNGVNLNTAISRLTSQFNLLQNNYSALDWLSQVTVKKTTALEKNINTLGAGTNFLRDRMEKIATQTVAVADNRVAQTINFENFSTENQAEVSSSLIETKLADQIFSGKYQAMGSYGEIKVDLGAKKDFSASDTDAGYLTFEIYLDNAEGLTDFNTELGNVMDQNELQWNRANHPYFTTGWNTVRLALNEGIKTGAVDWSALNYFRVYFSFGEAKEIRIRNVNLELKPKYVPLAQTVDAKELDLFNNVDQGTAIVVLSDKTNELGERLLAQESYVTQLDQNLQILSDLINGSELVSGLATQVIDHETRISALEELLVGGATIAQPELSLQFQELDSRLSGSDTAEGYLFDIDGNLKAQKVETEEIKAGDYVVKENVIPSQNNVGSVIIHTGEQEVLISNEKVMYNSKIIVTPVGSSPVAWVVSDKINGEGFKLKLDKPAEFDIAFDYWVIGVE